MPTAGMALRLCPQLDFNREMKRVLLIAIILVVSPLLAIPLRHWFTAM